MPSCAACPGRPWNGKKLPSIVGVGLVVAYVGFFHSHDIHVASENLKLVNELPSLIMKNWYSVNELAPEEANTNVTSALWRVPVADLNKRAVKGGIQNYLSNYRNPCWFQGSQDDSGLRCLPYFYLAGVAKCGTSSFYRQILRHDHIIQAASKELNFWQYPRKHNVHGYLELFRSANKQIFSYADDSGYHPKVVVDATPGILTSSYGIYSDESFNHDRIGPNFTLAHTLYALNPKTKIIVVLRNPTDRLFSHYHFRHERHLFIKQYSPHEFHTLAVNAVQMMTDCLRVRSLRSCAFDVDLTKRIEQEQSMTLSFGMYYPYVAEWLSIFPRNQIMLIKSEEMFKNVTKTLVDVYNFLEVDAPPSVVFQDAFRFMHKLKTQVESKATNNSSYRTTMLPKTKLILDQFHAQFNSKLAELLGDRKWLFDDPAVA